MVSPLQQMKQAEPHEKPSRKKPLIDSEPLEATSAILSENLHYSFLTDDPGDALTQLRREQIDQILKFLKANIKHIGAQQKNTSRILLAIGPPATGKTSTIKHCLSTLSSSVQKCPKEHTTLHSLEILSFNGHSLNKCQEIKKEIGKIQQREQDGDGDGGGTRIKWERVGVNQEKGDAVLTVVYVEEVERVVEGNGAEQLSDFMGLFFQPKHYSSGKKKQLLHRSILIGTSNTLTLPQTLHKKSPPPKPPTVLLFPPYSQSSQLQILQARLLSIERHLNIKIEIPEKLLKFLLCKLRENRRDDTRMLVGVVKEILGAVKESGEGGDGDGTVVISMEDIGKIGKLKALLNNSKVGLIQKLSFKQQLVLRIIHTYLKEHEALEMPYLQIVEQYKKYQKSMGITAYDDVTVAVKELETYSCLTIKSKSNSKACLKSCEKGSSKMTVVLKVSLNDIQHALSGNPIFRSYFASVEQ